MCDGERRRKNRKSSHHTSSSSSPPPYTARRRLSFRSLLSFASASTALWAASWSLIACSRSISRCLRSSLCRLFSASFDSPVAWRGVAWRGVAWRGVGEFQSSRGARAVVSVSKAKCLTPDPRSLSDRPLAIPLDRSRTAHKATQGRGPVVEGEEEPLGLRRGRRLRRGSLRSGGRRLLSPLHSFSLPPSPPGLCLGLSPQAQRVLSVKRALEQSRLALVELHPVARSDRRSRDAEQQRELFL